MGETDDFEWDDPKDAINRGKHGLPLLLAALLFEDEERLETVSQASTEAETRLIATGRAAGRVLTCVFLWRGARRRVISLRLASRKERRAYKRATRSGK